MITLLLVWILCKAAAMADRAMGIDETSK